MNMSKYKNGFDTGIEITSSEELIDRNSEGSDLEQLIFNLIQNQSNVQLLGQRRFGKTSVLKCAHNIIKDKYSDTKVSVFIDTTIHPEIIGINNGYILLCCFLIKGIFDNPNVDKTNFIMNEYQFHIYRDIKTQYKHIRGITDNGQVLFTQIIDKLAELSLSFILLIDEYEFLFHKTLNSYKPVRPIANLCQNNLANNQGLKVCIAGGKSWKHLSDLGIEGSPDFTFISSTIYLSKISEDGCRKIILDGLSKSNYDIENNKNEVDSLIQKAIILSGGCPNTIKFIGKDFITNNGQLDSSRILQNLDDIFHVRFHAVGKKQKDSWKQKYNLDDELVRLHTVETEADGQIIKFVGELWNTYVKKNQKTIPQNSLFDIIKNKLNNFLNFIGNHKNNQILNQLDKDKYNLVLKTHYETISDFFQKINNECEYKNIPHVFDFASSQDHHYQRDSLLSMCDDKNKFKIFCAQVYCLLMESTKGTPYFQIDNTRKYCYYNKKKYSKLKETMARLPSELWNFKMKDYGHLDKKVYLDISEYNPNGFIIDHIKTLRGYYYHTNNKKGEEIPLKFNINETMQELHKGDTFPNSDEDFIKLQITILERVTILLQYILNIIQKTPQTNYIELTT